MGGWLFERAWDGGLIGDGGKGVGEKGSDGKKGATARRKPARIPLRGNVTPIKGHSPSDFTIPASFPSIESMVPTSTLSYPACLFWMCYWRSSA